MSFILDAVLFYSITSCHVCVIFLNKIKRSRTKEKTISNSYQTVGCTIATTTTTTTTTSKYCSHLHELIFVI